MAKRGKAVRVRNEWDDIAEAFMALPADRQAVVTEAIKAAAAADLPGEMVAGIYRRAIESAQA